MKKHLFWQIPLIVFFEQVAYYAWLLSTRFGQNILETLRLSIGCAMLGTFAFVIVSLFLLLLVLAAMLGHAEGPDSDNEDFGDDDDWRYPIK